MARKLSDDEIRELMNQKPKKGRPMLRDKWGLLIEETLRKAGPNGMTPQELQRTTELEPHQIGGAVRWLRDATHEGPPVLYVPRKARWYAASHYVDHGRTGLREVFIQRAASMVLSAEKLLSQMEVQFPEKKPEIRRFQKDAARLREDAAELSAALN